MSRPAALNANFVGLQMPETLFPSASDRVGNNRTDARLCLNISTFILPLCVLHSTPSRDAVRRLAVPGLQRPSPMAAVQAARSNPQIPGRNTLNATEYPERRRVLRELLHCRDAVEARWIDGEAGPLSVQRFSAERSHLLRPTAVPTQSIKPRHSALAQSIMEPGKFEAVIPLRQAGRHRSAGPVGFPWALVCFFPCVGVCVVVWVDGCNKSKSRYQ